MAERASAIASSGPALWGPAVRYSTAMAISPRWAKWRQCGANWLTRPLSQALLKKKRMAGVGVEGGPGTEFSGAASGDGAAFSSSEEVRTGSAPGAAPEEGGLKTHAASSKPTISL